MARKPTLDIAPVPGEGGCGRPPATLCEARYRVRRSRRATLVAVLVCLSCGAASASASVVVGADDSNGSNKSLLVVGTGGNGASVRFEAPYVTVNAPEGVTLDSSAGAYCSETNEFKVTCDDAFRDFQAQFDAANDGLSEQVCFFTGT